MFARGFMVAMLMIAMPVAPAIAGAAEQLNNQAVALERAGDFAAAEATYAAAAARSPDHGIRVNQWRNRVRGFLRDYGPIAQQVVVLMLGVWVIRRLLVMVGRARASWRQYLRYRRLRVAKCTITAFDEHNQAGPDEQIYPDARVLRAAVTLRSAGVKDHALCIAANLIAPNGAVARTLRQFIESGVPPLETQINFDFDELSALLETGGFWQIEVVLENNGKRLFRRGAWVITREQMLDDLSVEDVRLMVTDGEQHVCSTVVPTTAQGIVPTAKLCVNTLRADKYRNLNLRLELVRAGDDQVEMAQHVPLSFENGVADFCHLSHPIAGSAIAEKAGDWQFRMFVEGRSIGTMDFVVRTPDELAQAARARLDVASTRAGASEVSLVGSSVSRFEADSLVPIARIMTPYRSPLAVYDVIFGAMAENEVIGHVQQRVALTQGVNTITGGELDLSKCEARGAVTFFLMINGHCVAGRDIELKLSRVRHADVEGRLTAEAHKSAVDDDEADQILNDAHVIV